MNLSQRFLLSAVTGAILLGGIRAAASDWPHWLGPNGNNIAPADAFETDLSKWKVAWQANVGHGYSSVAVCDGRAYTLGHDGQAQETVFCFDADTGRVVWKFAYDAQLIPRMHPGGPNATPTVVDDKVVTVSKDGQAFCLSADKGEKLWGVNLIDAMGIKLPNWGVASSPVIHDGKVLFSAGKVIALQFANGKTVWTSKDTNTPAYTTAVVFSYGSLEFVAALDGAGLSILKTSDGTEVARRPFKSNMDLTATTPFVLAQGGRIFISGNASSEMLRFNGHDLGVVWTSKEIKNAMNNSVILDNTLYGIDGRQNFPASRLVSVNLADGKLNWARPDFGYGNTIGVGSDLLALTESGELVTVKPAADAFQELARRQVLPKLCWTTPVFANQRIYVRNDQGDVVCLAPN